MGMIELMQGECARAYGHSQISTEARYTDGAATHRIEIDGFRGVTDRYLADVSFEETFEICRVVEIENFGGQTLKAVCFVGGID